MYIDSNFAEGVLCGLSLKVGLSLFAIIPLSVTGEKDVAPC